MPTLQNSDTLRLSRIRRRVELERRLQTDSMLSEERKNRQLQQLGMKESTFLRLKRTKLGLDDFRTVKIIGKGAFGEVSLPDFWDLCKGTMFRPLGQASTKGGHGQNICDETSKEGRNVKERPGMDVYY